MADRYDALVARKSKDGKTRWTKIGAAFPNKQDGFTVILDALPLPDEEGRCAISLFVPKPRDERGGGRGRSDADF